MKNNSLRKLKFCLILIFSMSAFPMFANGLQKKILLSCKADNDLYLTLKENHFQCTIYNSPEEAIKNATENSGVLILADGYPAKTTEFSTTLFEEARRKNLRLYIEFPSSLPGLKIGKPRSASLERVVVSTDSLSGLNKMQILAFHDCHYVPVLAENPLLVISKVAGFDRAVYGLNKDSTFSAILFETPKDHLLISTTKLSQFITARYAPVKGMQVIWSFILKWIDSGGATNKPLVWNPSVQPSFSGSEKLQPDAGRLAVQRGIDWHLKAKMVLNEQGWEEYKQLWKLNDSNMHTTVEAIDNAAPQVKADIGDGSFGLLEGIASKILPDGSQPTRWWLRSDSNGESSMAFALRWKMDGDKKSKLIAGNLLDWLYFKSGLFQTDSTKSNYGLLLWAPGQAQALYQDNDIKAILGCMGTSAILGTDCWDEVLVKDILGNFRTTGVNGFRGGRIENPDLLRDGWQKYWNATTILYQPHYEAWTWASYLWLYDKTHWKSLLDRTRMAITMMMKAYPNNWRWTNGIQQERGRMLLPLSWLIRIDDRPEYRNWLKQIATDIEKCQDTSGAIREELGALDHGDMAPNTSNESYGTGEAPLIQQNGDAISDLLYTCNFTSLGLHEAYAATGDPQYKRMADKLSEFLIRIQVKSDKHSELDGGWFRAFDYRQWEYWGSNADSGWGAWSIEVGWTQAWIPSVLAMRELKINLWDLTKNSKAGAKFDNILKQMIPDELIKNMKYIQ